jgi:APA family basic amino acid/polyamine antiporter
VTLVYVVTTCAFIYLVPADAVTSSAEFARGPVSDDRQPRSLASTAVPLLSVTVSMLALLVMAPRLYVAMGQDSLFPRALAALHPATGAPVRATGLMAVLASGFVLAGTFQEIVAFFICTALVFVALAAAALFIVRRRTTGAPAFSVPGYPLVPVLFVLLVGCVTLLIAINQPWQAAAGCGLMLAGLPVHAVLRARGGLRPHAKEGSRE